MVLRVESPFDDTDCYAPGYGRAHDIHDRLRSLQVLLWSRIEVRERGVPNLTVADSSGSRCIAGLLHGNGGVAKSKAGELTHSTDITQVSGLLSIALALGTTFGYGILRPQHEQLSPMYNSPLAGGALSHPRERFPALFGNQLWEEYPYLLSCLSSAAFSSLCSTLNWAFLKEVRESAWSSE